MAGFGFRKSDSLTAEKKMMLKGLNRPKKKVPTFVAISQMELLNKNKQSVEAFESE